MINDIEYISKEKKTKLEKELEELKTVKRKEIIESLEFAKSLGDLSENAEYQQAREDQAKLEERISEIENILKSSVIITKKANRDVVEIGSKVTIKKEGGGELTYQIVGSTESDTEQNKISNKSPLGEALFGNKANEIILVKGPQKTIKYKILKIE
ncbi:transcription elongation factor GreA [Candidatus Nomurabacteria bacterium RIFCSPLOWO2_01_FULL_33_24]|uniref:Transcription elongation factor GreA n=1 Tax=Candidatus Nomurabacteria bacterium RIFCSPLOWO2_01_FULL_33_24 TaxID=1801765 RepID=A0A1F6X007_9BACT|nr:MAG: transcription elongation factor GreA [Candidatus Nomurabacteria bacterium RIFCSPLOWO2_01_FULL_33_24]